MGLIAALREMERWRRMRTEVLIFRARLYVIITTQYWCFYYTMYYCFLYIYIHTRTWMFWFSMGKSSINGGFTDWYSNLHNYIYIDSSCKWTIYISSCCCENGDFPEFTMLVFPSVAGWKRQKDSAEWKGVSWWRMADHNHQEWGVYQWWHEQHKQETPLNTSVHVARYGVNRGQASTFGLDRS